MSLPNSLPPAGRRLLALALLSLLAGCASPDPVTLESSLGLERLRPGWWASAPQTSVGRLRQEAERYAGEPACLGARLLEVPEVAHALWLESKADERTRLGEALAAAGAKAYAASAAARAGDVARATRADLTLLNAQRALESDPQRAHDLASEAEVVYRELGDALLLCEARQVQAAASLAGGEEVQVPGGVAPAQVGQALLLRLGLATRRGQVPADEVLRELSALRHGAGLERLTVAYQRGAVSFTDTFPLQLARAELAAERGEGERSLLAAELALRAAGEAHPNPRAQQARLARAVARLTLEQSAAAAIDAAEVAEDPATASLAARAESLLGQALWARGQPEAAAEAYERAVGAASRARDPAAEGRARINRATALLKSAGSLEEVQESLRPVPGAPPSVEAQRRVLVALFELLRGQVSGLAAAEEIDAALVRARRVGAYAVVQRYRDLPNRVRERSRSVGSRGPAPR